MTKTLWWKLEGQSLYATASQNLLRGYDERRTRWLERHGFRVLRFWDNQVFLELEAVLRVIETTLDCPPPLSST